MEEIEKKKRKKLLVGISITLLIIIGLGLTYAYIIRTFYGDNVQTIVVGNLHLTLNEANTLELADGKFLSDADGLSQDGFTFSVKNDGLSYANYSIYLDDDTLEAGKTRIDDSFIKYSLDVNGKSGTPTVLSDRMIYTGDIGVKKTDAFVLRVWLNADQDGDVAGQVFKVKLRIEVVQDSYRDSSGASIPELATNMIPVKYDGTNWVKANTNDTWYDYNNQEWANAVTVSAASRANYLSAEANTPISMDDINTMWVWIPRYSYTIGSVDGTNYYGKQGEYLSSAPTQALPGEIDVKFIPTSTKETGSAQYKVSEGVSGWRTPDGFTFGDKELSGVWVAKFETSNQEGTYESDDNSLTPIVKPSVTPWRDLKVSTMETVSMNMTKGNNIYGLMSSEVDSHMMKNSEWSLVAYLSQSKYGKIGSESYTGANKEIYINNYSGYKTGCSAGAPSTASSSTCAFEYNNVTDRGSGKGSGGGGASTTGNIYGIYDMSGGAYEYVMGNYNNYSGAYASSNSGYSGTLGGDNSTFNGIPFPESKYYDLYATNNANTACNGKACTSHALSEVAGWYGDAASMVDAGSPWLLRGGYCNRGSDAGVFDFGYNSGNANDIFSFRLVLTP